MRSLLIYLATAFLEIGGCFAFWTHFRLHRSPWWILPGLLSLAAFAYFLTLAESAFAGRAYAAYGGVYIVASLLWLLLVEQVRPDMWDMIGGAVCVAGSLLILLPNRG